MTVVVFVVMEHTYRQVHQVSELSEFCALGLIFVYVDDIINFMKI